MIKTINEHYYEAIDEQNSYNGGLDYQAEEYIYTLPFEGTAQNPSSQLKQRMSRFFHFNYCKMIINKLIAEGAKGKTTYQGCEKLNLSNIDGQGNSIEDQRKLVDQKSAIQGMVYLGLVEEKNNKFIKIFDRKDIIDWQLDKEGGFEWVKIAGSRINQDDPNSEKETIKIIYLYTKNAIITYELNKEDKWIIVDNIINPFESQGIIPIVMVKQDPDANSYIRDIWKLNRQLDNYESILELTLMLGSQIIPEMNAGVRMEDNGTAKIYRRDSKDDKGLIFRSPENETPIRLLSTIEKIKEFLETFGDIKENSGRVVSGIALDLDLEDRATIAQNKAKDLDEAYTRILKMLSWWQSITSVDYKQEEINVFTEFSKSQYSDNSELENINILKEGQLPDSAYKALLKKQLAFVLNDIDQKEFDLIMSDVDKMQIGEKDNSKAEINI